MNEAALHWADAVRGDRADLQNFVCRPPGTKVRRFNGGYYLDSPEPSGYVVQKIIRGRLRPPVQPPEFAIVGRDDAGICAVGHFLAPDANSGHRVFNLSTVAVALRCRTWEIRVADLLMHELLEAMAALARDQALPLFVVQARIAEDNVGSQRLVQRFGFQCAAEEGGQVDGPNGEQEVTFGVWQVELSSG